MEAIVTGVCVGAVMLLLNGIVAILKNNAKKAKRESETTFKNKTRIEMLERTTGETRELVKLTLQTCIILGDGMVQNGINGEFKKAFCEKKQDAFKML